MTRIVLVVTYLAATLAVVVLINANTGDGSLPLAIWAIASVLLGLGTGRLSFALLAFLAIPFAIPFGYPDNYQYSEPLPIWWAAGFYGCFSAGLIFLAAIVRRIIESRRQHGLP
jgi:hypothetical protein